MKPIRIRSAVLVVFPVLAGCARQPPKWNPPYRLNRARKIMRKKWRNWTQKNKTKPKEKTGKKNMKNQPYAAPETVFLFLVFVFVQAISGPLDLYNRLPAYDIMTHFIGAAFVCSITTRFFLRHMTRHPYFSSVLATLGIAAIWEMLEFFSDYFLGTRTQASLQDTMGDLTDGLAAAVVFVLIHRTKNNSPSEKQALY